MANRNKPLSAQSRTALRAAAALAQHLPWQKWPPARRVAFIFSPNAAQVIGAQAEPHSALAQLHRHCVATRTSNEQGRIRHFLTQLLTDVTHHLLPFIEKSICIDCQSLFPVN